MKVAILGTVPVHRQLAPFNDHEWEIWACSAGNAHGVLPRVTKWFEIHGVVDMTGPEHAAWSPGYFEWLRKQPFPIYMQEKNDVVPQATVFPIKALLNEFDPFSRIAFTSSISMMTAYAIFLGATEIAIYGVDMAADSEAYSGQKPGCQIMMAIAKQRGIRVQVPLESCLGQLPPLYGYAEATRMGRRLLTREQQLEQGVAGYDATLARLREERAEWKGALDDVRYMRRTFVDGADAELDAEEAALTMKRPVEGRMVEPEFGAYRLDKESNLLVPKVNGSGLSLPDEEARQ